MTPEPSDGPRRLVYNDVSGRRSLSFLLDHFHRVCIGNGTIGSSIDKSNEGKTTDPLTPYLFKSLNRGSPSDRGLGTETHHSVREDQFWTNRVGKGRPQDHGRRFHLRAGSSKKLRRTGPNRYRSQIFGPSQNNYSHWYR